MKVGTTHYRSIWPIGDNAVGIVDQTRLPHAFATRTVTGSDDMIAAIKTMAVRGAPLIGVAGAYGLALAMRDDASDANLSFAHQRLNAARPTAVNLRWALDRMQAFCRHYRLRNALALHGSKQRASPTRTLRSISRLVVMQPVCFKRCTPSINRTLQFLPIATRAGWLRSTTAPRSPGSIRRTTPVFRCMYGSARRGRETRAC